jgi:predicted nuclease of restriction endonuclease-like (RecB) superfamily
MNKFCNRLLQNCPGAITSGSLEQVKDLAERLWYAEQTLADGWSRNVLLLQIEDGLYRRQGKAITNFDRTLPPPQSDLAQQITIDPYNFDVLALGPEAHERDLERGLLNTCAISMRRADALATSGCKIDFL